MEPVPEPVASSVDETDIFAQFAVPVTWRLAPVYSDLATARPPLMVTAPPCANDVASPVFVTNKAGVYVAHENRISLDANCAIGA